MYIYKGKKRYLAQWRLSVPKRMEELATLVCEHLEQSFPIYVGAIHNYWRPTVEDKGTYARIVFVPPPPNADTIYSSMQVEYINLSRNNIHDFFHELIHLVLNINGHKDVVNIGLGEEEYLCELHAFLLEGKAWEEANDRANSYGSSIEFGSLFRGWFGRKKESYNHETDPMTLALQRSFIFNKVLPNHIRTFFLGGPFEEREDIIKISMLLTADELYKKMYQTASRWIYEDRNY